MKRTQVIVPWPAGLRLHVAARLAQVARRFRSSLLLHRGAQAADLRSVLAVLTLCASMGTPLDLQASGDDEQDAVAAMERIFSGEERGELG